MKITNRNYPYPVLSSFTDDYIDSSYDVEMSVDKLSENIVFDIKAYIINSEIEKLLESGDLELVYHFENSQTGYRTVVQTQDLETRYSIPEKNLNGRLEISPFIVIRKRIEKYTNMKFHEDYYGIDFDLESGTIIGVGNQFTINIDKNEFDIRKKESIFSIIRNLDDSKRLVYTDTTKSKINIIVPNSDFKKYSQISKISDVVPIITSTLILPVLIETLHQVAKINPYDRELEFESQKWYRMVKRILIKEFDIDIETDELESNNVFEISQKLLGHPITEALIGLNDIFTKVEEDFS